MAALEKEFKYYVRNQDMLLKTCLGKYIVIKEEEVLGVYDSETQAITETSKKHALGTFLIQKCEPGSANYTQTYHSRAIFA